LTGSPGYAKYYAAGVSGYLVSPPESRHALLTIRHTAGVPPWSDDGLHVHSESEEYYLLLHGELQINVAGHLYSLLPREMLGVRAAVPHAVVRGQGAIEHFGFRAPAVPDREIVAGGHFGVSEAEWAGPRDITMPWGFRASFSERSNCNCWLVGKGEATHHSDDFLFAFLDFPTSDQATAGLGTRLRMHAHTQSWEYYLCLEGSKTLQVNEDTVEVQEGEIVEVHPGARHNVIDRRAPYIGATFRVPLLNDKTEA